MSETLQRYGDHFYVTVDQRYNDASSSYLTDDLEIDSSIHIIIPEPSGQINFNPISKVVLNYKIGEGFIDYDYVGNSSFDGVGYYKNDSIVAMGFKSKYFLWNYKFYIPDEVPETTEYRSHIAVIDHTNDSLIFTTQTSTESFMEVMEIDMLTVEGDYLYVVTRTNIPTFEFMSEIFTSDNVPNGNVKYIHKINWKIGVKEWSRQFGTVLCTADLFDIKVVTDGSLIIAIRMQSHTYWEGFLIPEDTAYYGYAFFKISPNGDFLDYIQSACECKGFHKIQIEDNGALMLHET